MSYSCNIYLRYIYRLYIYVIIFIYIVCFLELIYFYLNFFNSFMLGDNILYVKRKY